MKQTHRIHVCLIICLIHYFDIMNSLKSDKTYYILIQYNESHLLWIDKCDLGYS